MRDKLRAAFQNIEDCYGDHERVREICEEMLTLLASKQGEDEEENKKRHCDLYALRLKHIGEYCDCALGECKVLNERIAKQKQSATPSNDLEPQASNPEKDFRNFLQWLGEQNRYTWNGEMWSENGQGDPQEFPMVDMFDYWKGNIKKDFGPEVRNNDEAATQPGVYDKAVEGRDNAWPLRDVLNKLIEASEILLHKKDYDGHGWEEIGIAVKRAKEIVTILATQPTKPDRGMSVRKFMLKKFPTNEYTDCPIPKEYWEIIQEYADWFLLHKSTEPGMSDAVEFAEWAADNFKRMHSMWHTYYAKFPQGNMTTEQLYHQFKNR